MGLRYHKPSHRSEKWYITKDGYDSHMSRASVRSCSHHIILILLFGLLDNGNIMEMRCYGLVRIVPLLKERRQISFAVIYLLLYLLLYLLGHGLRMCHTAFCWHAAKPQPLSTEWDICHMALGPLLGDALPTHMHLHSWDPNENKLYFSFFSFLTEL